MMAEERMILSPTGYAVLLQELADLEAEHETRQAEFADTNYDVDPSQEEAAYFDRRVTKEHLEERIGHLKLILEQAEVLEHDPDPDRIDPGDQVTLWDFTEKRERVFNIVSSAETIYARDGIPGREVSTESPVGQALLGKQVGDVIELDVPDGKAKYAIRKISPLSTPSRK
jgi:transcription elongation factor GreA